MKFACVVSAEHSMDLKSRDDEPVLASRFVDDRPSNDLSDSGFYPAHTKSDCRLESSPNGHLGRLPPEMNISRGEWMTRLAHTGLELCCIEQTGCRVAYDLQLRQILLAVSDFIVYRSNPDFHRFCLLSTVCECDRWQDSALLKTYWLHTGNRLSRKSIPRPDDIALVSNFCFDASEW